MGTKHPIEEKRYFIPMPEMIVFHEHVMDTYDLGLCGTICYAAGGTGKTTAIAYSSNKVVEDLGDDAPAVLVSILGEGISYQPKALLCELTKFWPDFGTLKFNVTLERMKDAVIAYLSEAGVKHNNEILMYIDEAQSMSTENLTVLMYISNILRFNKISITYILVGQMSLKYLRNAMIGKKGEYEHIIRRFMNTEHEVHGLNGYNDIYCFFKGHDIIRYNDLTYTGYFFPNGFAKGKLLADEAQVFYDVLKEESGLEEIPEMTMFEITTIIRHVFIHGKRSKKEWPDKEDWRCVVKKLDFGHKLRERASMEEIEAPDELFKKLKQNKKKKKKASNKKGA